MSDETEITPLGDKTEEAPPVETPPEEKKPVLTINIFSWATPIIGLVMLILGLFVGYFTRPLFTPSKLIQIPTSTTQAKATTSLKDAVVAQTRHFMGDANAPVTIVEFGDFQ